MWELTECKDWQTVWIAAYKNNHSRKKPMDLKYLRSIVNATGWLLELINVIRARKVSFVSLFFFLIFFFLNRIYYSLLDSGPCWGVKPQVTIISIRSLFLSIKDGFFSKWVSKPGKVLNIIGGLDDFLKYVILDKVPLWSCISASYSKL